MQVCDVEPAAGAAAEITRRPRWTAEAAAGLRAQGPFLLLVATYALAGAVAGWTLGLPRLMRHLWYPYSYTLYATMAVCAVPLIVARARWRVRDAAGGRMYGRPGWAAAWRECRRDFFNVRRLAEAAGLVLAVPLLMNALGGWKSAIPALHPFSWDPAFDRLDLALHLGQRPWELLQGLLGRPAVTDALDSAYYAWFMVAMVVVVWHAWTTDRAQRTRFFLAFALCWIVLGTAFAILFSSAGPCYFDRVTGLESPYRPLMEYLHAVNGEHRLIALWGQDVLWQDYVGVDDNPFNGISAMPSLHVAMPVLFALAGWRIHRPAGVALGLYALVTLVGSVHLGWHYAVDGYASLMAVPVLWWAAGRITDHPPWGASR